MVCPFFLPKPSFPNPIFWAQGLRKDADQFQVPLCGRFVILSSDRSGTCWPGLYQCCRLFRLVKKMGDWSPRGKKTVWSRIEAGSPRLKGTPGTESGVGGFRILTVFGCRVENDRVFFICCHYLFASTRLSVRIGQGLLLANRQGSFRQGRFLLNE